MTAINGTKSYVFEGDVPFGSCHASTVTRLSGGDIAAAWFGGTCEGDPDVDIWMSLRHGDQWSPPVKAAQEEGMPHWNPVLFEDDDQLYLFYKVGHTFSDWYTRFIVSGDGGLTWSPPAELVPGDRGGRGPVRNKPIKLRSGLWLAPASLEQEAWEAFVDRSADRGRTWKRSAMIATDIPREPGRGVIQPALWESAPDQVHMLLRSTEGRIYRSDSSDGGATWSAAYATSLPNNNSGIDIARLPDGQLALAYNPVGSNWGPRTPLVIGLSGDNGETWEQALALEEDEGEYSYPSVAEAGGKLHVTYTWNRQKVAFWELTM
ncbi:sialidase family protein [Paenibacillus harenae]|uniref:sialidase family protein n=1 Tax=Paenibacillus harenae TaxID=306543 RepID=UPI002790BC71|nr:sialidase family protein [Paenibacillus harenae]MDQ0063445.1 putative neuraminidase [Paenibacillus harenae]